MDSQYISEFDKPDFIWSLPDNERRRINAARASAGARQQLIALNGADEIARLEKLVRDTNRDILIVKQIVLPEGMPPWKRILQEAAANYRVSVEDILGGRRTRPIVRARHEAAYRMHHELRMSFPAIGRRLGGKDHTTIINGVNVHEKRLAEARGIAA